MQRWLVVASWMATSGCRLRITFAYALRISLEPAVRGMSSTVDQCGPAGGEGGGGGGAEDASDHLKPLALAHASNPWSGPVCSYPRSPGPEEPLA